MSPSPAPRQTLTNIVSQVKDHESRIDDHENRLDDLEARLAKYDAIVVRLDTWIDVLSKRVEETARHAEEAIDGQAVLEERNANTNRWNTLGISLAASFIVGIAMFLLGYVLHP